MLKTGNWVRYCIFDLATGKAEQENNFPTSNLAFLGQSERNVAIFTAGQVNSSSFLTVKHDVYLKAVRVSVNVCFIFFLGVSHCSSGRKWHDLSHG